ncbi:hypothetical protein HKD37_18G050392 [Glycine soja]
MMHMAKPTNSPPPPLESTPLPVRMERPVVHVDPATRKANGSHRKKLRTYLGIIARDKVDITFFNWKEVPATQKDLIWEDIQTKFDIPKALNQRTKKKIHKTIGERSRHFKPPNGLWHKARKGTMTLSVISTILAKKSGNNFVRVVETLRGRRHAKWKMARTKIYEKITSETACEIEDSILCRPWTSGCVDCCHWATKHSRHVYVAGAILAIKQYFGPTPKSSRTSTSMTHKAMEQMTQKLGTSWKSRSLKKLALLLSVSAQKEVVSMPRDTGDSEKYGLYVNDNPSHLVALERFYEGSTTIHNFPLGNDYVKIDVEEVRDADARVHVPTQEDKQGAERSTKPVDRSEPDGDLLYQMTLTILQLFPKPLQVSWDATVFGVYNDNFPCT